MHTGGGRWPAALLAAKAAGHTHVILDGSLIYTDRDSTPGPRYDAGESQRCRTCRAVGGHRRSTRSMSWSPHWPTRAGVRFADASGWRDRAVRSMNAMAVASIWGRLRAFATALDFAPHDAFVCSHRGRDCIDVDPGSR